MAAVCTWALADGAGKIEFEKTVYDFGKHVSASDSVAGSFKFKNTGDGVLKVLQATASCGCTVPKLEKDTLNPGETGELTFTLNLGKSKALLHKNITVSSNDPDHPSVVLSVKVDYTPLYQATPPSLYANVPAGDTFTTHIDVKRTDDKPILVDRIVASKPWIMAKLGPNAPDESTARIQVEIKGDGAPKGLSESIYIYGVEDKNSPIATVSLSGRMMGDLDFSPQRVYWSITDPDKIKSDPTGRMVTRHVTVRSASGEHFELKNPRSSIEGLDIEFEPKDGGSSYDVTVRLSEIPEATAVGLVSFDTSSKNLPELNIPITIAVVKRPQARTVTPAPPPLLARPPATAIR